MSYIQGLPENEKSHDEFHDKYLYGAKLPVLPTLIPIGTVGEYPIFIVDASIPKRIRVQLSKITFVAQIETPEFSTGYDGNISEAGEQLFLLTNSNRAIAFVLTALDEYYWNFIWSANGTPKLLNKKAYRVTRQKIGRIWVAKGYRRQGIGALMTKTVVRHLGYDLSDIGWELPLTEDGTALLRRLVPLKWWGRGDSFAVQETISITMKT